MTRVWSTVKLAAALGVLAVPAAAAARIGPTKQADPPGLLERFSGSSLRLSTKLGSGTFSDDAPYTAEQLQLYPHFQLAGRHTLRLLWALECQLNEPSACESSDLRLSYHHSGLWVDPWAGGRLFTYVAAYLPTSSASQDAGTLFNLRLLGGYHVRFWRERIELSYALGVQKFVPEDRRRGGGSSASSGMIGSAGGAAGATGSGGRFNDNWLFLNAFHAAAYFMPNLWFSIDLMILNTIRFATPADALTASRAVETGRADATRGVLELGYAPLSWLLLQVGVDSQQPMHGASGASVRFPFFDVVTPGSNYTKVYMTVTLCTPWEVAEGSVRRCHGLPEIY